MEHRFTARGGVIVFALLAGLGACADSPVAPTTQPALVAGAGDEFETAAAGFSAADAFLTVSAGLGFTCGTTLDGAAYCWGENGSGQLGTGDFTGRAVPARLGGVQGALAASTGAAHACVLTAAGRVYCWGDNSVGQLGDGGTVGSPVPVQVQRPAGVLFLSITTGAVHSCALASDGGTYCWGDNSVGQLGDGTTAGSPVPVRVQAPAGTGFLGVTSGDGAAHTCAVTTGGVAWCWGDNSYGQLGTGAAGAPATVPVPVAGGITFFSVAGSGIGHSCGIAASGQAYCWGDNSNGQLGDGSTAQRLVPTPVLGGRRYLSLQTGWFHSCGATVVAGADCWGDANGGKLGNGVGNGFSATPVAVQGSQGFGRMDPGADHTCSRRIDGEALCWGQGFSGQLGDGAMTNSAVPVQVADPSAQAASDAPSFNSSGADAASAPAERGIGAWCVARADRGRIAACS